MEVFSLQKKDKYQLPVTKNILFRCLSHLYIFNTKEQYFYFSSNIQFKKTTQTL